MINNKCSYIVINDSKYTRLQEGQKAIFISNSYDEALKVCNYLNNNKLKYGSNEDNYIILTFNYNINKKVIKDMNKGE